MRLIKWCYDHRIILLIDILCLLLGLICLAASEDIGRKAYDQQEGSRWAAGELSYHQVSAFFPVSQKLSRQSISGIRAELQRNINEASLSDEGRGRPWADAYAAFDSGDITKVTSLGMAGVENASVIGVSEDFFLFHPMNIVTGSVLPQDMVNDDLILIDRETAWALYGSVDIVGQKVYLGGMPFIISGVYDPDDSKMSQKAIQQKKCIMISYAAFEKLYEDTPITFYEAVIPNPVSTFAINSLQDATGGEDSGVVLVDNEVRFSTRALLTRFSDIHLLLMETNDVIFPYWENRMRGTEWDLFLLLILRFILFMPPVVSLIFVFVSFIRNRGRKLWQSFAAGLKERIRRRLWERPVKKKVGIEDEDF